MTPGRTARADSGRRLLRERGPDGSWPDGLLMDLVAPEFVDR
ncbi:hypothetical protein [Jiangella muralis]|nr:hypothetical protein [Jiangella muralis]